MPRGTAENVKLGPGYLYFGPVGAVEPTDLTTPWATVDPLWLPVGYTDEGSTFSYELSSDNVDVAEELDHLRVETTGRSGKVSFAMAELTARNVGYALNGGDVVTAVRLIGTATIVASTGVFTTSVAHSLVVGDRVVLGTITGTTGVTAGTTYYVKTAPTGTTFTLSATAGGPALTLTTDGSTASVSEVLGLVTYEPPDLGAEVRRAIGFESEDHSERWVFRKCFQTGNVEIARQKAPNKSVIPVEFSLEVPTGARVFKALFDEDFAD